MNTYEIKVAPGSRKNSITQDGPSLKVSLTAPAYDGKANKALVKLLADHFRVRKSQIELIKGLKSRLKTIRIKDI